MAAADEGTQQAVRSIKTEAASSGIKGKGRAQPGREADAHVGTVLRTVYQQAVEEDIPAEMLDLLRKLD